MEISIDTSAIKTINKSEQSTKIEENINNCITNFIADSSKTNLILKEDITISINAFIIDNPIDISLVIYGQIEENNQTKYNISVKDKVLIYIKNQFIINKFISNRLKNSSLEKISIENCIIIKQENFKQNKNTIYLIMAFINSIVKIFFTLHTKFKYNKWDNILLLTNSGAEAFFLCLILSLLEYNLSIDSAFISNDKKLPLDLFNILFKDNSKVKIFDSSNKDDMPKYDFIIDNTDEFIKDKLNAFSALAIDGFYIKLNSNKNYDS